MLDTIVKTQDQKQKHVTGLVELGKQKDFFDMFGFLFGKKYVINILGGKDKGYYKVNNKVVKFKSKEAAEAVSKTIKKSTIVTEFKK